MPRAGRLLVREPRLTEIGQPRLVVLVEQHVGRLQVAVQHALAVRVHQPDGHLAEQLDGLGRRQRPVLAQQVFERAVLDVLHHVVRRVGVPADVEQLHHVAVGRKEDQLLDLAREERPVEPAAVRVELDRHPAAGVAVDRHPHFAVGARAEELLRIVAGNFGRRLRSLQAQVLRLRCSSLDCCCVWSLDMSVS